MLFNFAAARRAGLESLCGSCSNGLVHIGLIAVPLYTFPFFFHYQDNAKI